MKLINYFSKQEIIHLMASAKEVEEFEERWKKKFQDYINKTTKKITSSLINSGKVSGKEVSFEQLLVEHAIESYLLGFSTAPQIERKKIAMSIKKFPRRLDELMKLWDLWRKGKQVPKKIKTNANNIKEAYISKLEKFWKRNSDDFRQGRAYDIKKASDAIKKAAKTSYGRANMIVATETTAYYNQARRNLYDKSEDVTHYLFLAIRDHRTTQWCKDRHGLVYKKGSKVLQIEQPPAHWNCRSEITPLTKHNPKHAKLINDKSLARENNRCKPLPKEWTGRDWHD